jgi:site-specific DNA-methyltransferase (adenine-specific)
MTAEKVVIGNAELWHGDCREVLPLLPAVDCVITDPPYFKVKGDYWDNEWDRPAAFLDWMRGILGLLADRMKPNGSAYVFASPQMAGRVETVAWERLNVLGHIVWRKGRDGMREASRANAAEKEALRSYFMTTERVIFAEHYNSDNYARGEDSYVEKCDELRGFVFEPLRAYLAGEWERAGLTKKDADKATGTQMAGHWFTRVQWALPTQAHYERLRETANANGGEYLRREYKDLRREYEDLRRPFSLTPRDQWSDVWDFEPVAAYPGKHPCEKPLSLLAHMLNASTKPGALVLDAFMGSGATGDACARLGRRFIGIERDRKHFDSACRRLEHQRAQVGLFA